LNQKNLSISQSSGDSKEDAFDDDAKRPLFAVQPPRMPSVLRAFSRVSRELSQFLLGHPQTGSFQVFFALRSTRLKKGFKFEVICLIKALP
jgi:hypothetical protein